MSWPEDLAIKVICPAIYVLSLVFCVKAHDLIIVANLLAAQ